MKKKILMGLWIICVMVVFTGCGYDYYDYGYNDDGYCGVFYGDDGYGDDGYCDDGYCGVLYGDDGYGDDDYGDDDSDVGWSDGDENSQGEGLGSAKEMDGTTVVVSIFMDDSNTSWDFSNQEDRDTRSDCKQYMGVATDWLTEQCADYGVNSDFIYDWNQNIDLYMTGSINCDATDDYSNDLYYEEMEWVDGNVDSEAILSEYSADNIIYMMYINTEYSSQIPSCTYVCTSDSEYPYEIVTIYVRAYGEDESPATYAHEILHTFGAPDLYMADEDGTNYGITQEYVDELEEMQSNDIMFTTYDAVSQIPYYDHISNEFSEIIAYYVGLTDYSSVVEQWGFDRSEH